MSYTEFPETFDPSTEESDTFVPVPPGEYVAQIIEAEIRQPRSGDGHALRLIWQILEGKHEGRQIFQWLSFQHSSEQTQTIARKTLKSLCDAIGWSDVVKDASVFLHKPCRVRVKIETDKTGSYDDQNKITRIKTLLSSPDPAAAQANQPSPPKSDNGGAAAVPEKPKPVPAAPRTQGAPRPGPAGTAPWHKQK
jgi:hypothetical protein